MEKNYLYISVGATNAMFTLRERALDVSDNGLRKKWYDRYLQNLSIDFDKAFEKAVVISLASDTPLRVNEKELVEEELREIKRMNAEQIAEREERMKEAQRDYQVWLDARDAEIRNRIAAGFVPFGAYRNYNINDLPVGYISWIVGSIEEFQPNSWTRILAEEIVSNYQHLLLPVPHKELTRGAVGERIKAEVTVIRTGNYATMTPVGYANVFVTTMVDTNGVCYVVKSQSFHKNLGEKFNIIGTVKDHSEYNGQMQTVLQRAKAA